MKFLCWTWETLLLNICLLVTSSGGIYTVDTCGPTDFCWAEHPVVNRVIIQSAPLKDAFSG